MCNKMPMRQNYLSYKVGATLHKLRKETLQFYRKLRVSSVTKLCSYSKLQWILKNHMRIRVLSLKRREQAVAGAILEGLRREKPRRQAQPQHLLPSTPQPRNGVPLSMYEMLPPRLHVQ